MQNDQPPCRIGRRAIHPVGQRRMLAAIRQRTPDGRIVAEQTGDRSRFGMHIAYPDQTVALDAVPEIIVHIQHERTRRHAEYFVDTLVAASKTAFRLQFTAETCRHHRFDINCFLFQKINADKAETRFEKPHIRIHDEKNLGVAQGMIVSRHTIALFRTALGN